ncbi:RNA polymerase sigma factor [Caryophanon latum]|uniref:RNA polymerase subunit sigma-70 n=1 Tax=Caryophanon latum TaxID=33977 RepID=A0A1C0YV71_9BACL|nr:sigma-70 family RNA polymerase sigma factor [Caryophanon latum]OCS91042.1 RNA polymerase subunit sigma-70 [Caryophanon latum]
MDIDALIDEHSDYLYRIAFIYTKDLQVAEEVVQDVFFNFYRTNQYDGRASVKTYLTKMTINRSYDYLRSWKHRRTVVFEAFTKSGASAEHKAVATEERTEVTNAVLQLPVKYREVLLLYYYEELNVNEIAELCKLPLSTVKSRLQRARQQLKTILPQTEWEVLHDA